MLGIWNDIDPGDEREFNDWYTREHLPERVAIPGFQRGRRYVRWEDEQPSAQKYLTLYETESVETLASAPYLDRLDNPTEWTRRILPRFKRSARAACRVTGSIGVGIGGSLATLQFEPASTKEDELRHWLLTIAMPNAVEQPDVIAIHLCEADVEATRAKDDTEESGAAGGRWPSVRWMILVEAARPAGLDLVELELRSGDGIPRHGGTREISGGRYSVMMIR